MNCSLLLLCLLAGPDPLASTERVNQNQKPSRSVFGLPTGSAVVRSGLVARNQNLSGILGQLGLTKKQIHGLTRAARPVFDVRRLKPGRSWQAFSEPDSRLPRYLVYGHNTRDYVVFDLGPRPHVYCGQNPVTLRENTASCTVTHSLSGALSKRGLPAGIAPRLASVFQAEVDFKKLSRGDRFSLIYEQEWIGDRLVGTGKIKAAWFQHRGKSFYRFLLEDSDRPFYVDEQGSGVAQIPFGLPLARARLSSPYSGKRFHPVLKRYTAHLGTDYAAPQGTPILAVADGVVSKAEYGRWNGNFVKISHGSVYETQYLHMSRFKKGVVPSSRVKRGDVIGYVGSTGLARGTHVCLRLWKNGRQVDFRKQPKVMPKQQADQQLAKEVIHPLKSRLDRASRTTNTNKG